MEKIYGHICASKIRLIMEKIYCDIIVPQKLD